MVQKHKTERKSNESDEIRKSNSLEVKSITERNRILEIPTKFD